MKLKRLPYAKWYFSDWRAEPRLKLCSRAARSFFFALLGFMHEADPYGFLLIEGIAPSPGQIANLTGDAERDVKKWLVELRAAGVRATDTIYPSIGHATPIGTFSGALTFLAPARADSLRFISDHAGCAR